jgi:predicted nucleic acid-binding protein
LIVLDASLIVAHVLGEEAIVARADIIETLKNGKIVVPAHWTVEISNAMITNVRRRRLSFEDAQLVLQEIAKYDVEVRPASPGDISTPISFAHEQQLTAYDAAYVKLAMDTRATLATLDDAMRRAAMRLQIDVAPD